MAFMTDPGAPAVPASPAPLAPSSGIGGRRYDVADLDVRHLDCHRDEIIGHVAVQKLSALVVLALLEQRRADACTTPPRTCSSTSCGLMTVPQSSTHQCLSR